MLTMASSLLLQPSSYIGHKHLITRPPSKSLKTTFRIPSSSRTAALPPQGKRFSLTAELLSKSDFRKISPVPGEICVIKLTAGAVYDGDIQPTLRDYAYSGDIERLTKYGVRVLVLYKPEPPTKASHYYWFNPEVTLSTLDDHPNVTYDLSICRLNPTVPIIDGNEAAAEMACQVGAAKLIIFSDMPGLLKDVGDPLSLIRETTLKEVEGMLETGTISGGMQSKIKACITALSRGVRVVSILPWSVEGAIIIDMLTVEGCGTRIFPC